MRKLIQASLASIVLHLFVLTLFGAGTPATGAWPAWKLGTPDLAVFLAPVRGQLPETETPPTSVDMAQVALSQRSSGMPVTEDNPVLGDPAANSSSVIPIDNREELGPPFPPPLPEFLPANWLDTPPRPMAELDTRFPALEGRNLAGRMVFSLLIDEQGRVVEVLNESSGLGPEVVEIVRQTLAALRYTAGMRQGQPVKSRTRMEIVLSYAVN